MYQILYDAPLRKDFKKLNKLLRKIIKNQHFSQIAQNPYKGEKLHGKLKGLWKYNLSYKGTEFRIVYKIYKEDKVVTLIMIGSRENFYEKLKRRAAKR